MELYIKSWALWMPPEFDINNIAATAQPELSHIPAMTRRRLSKLTKQAFEVAINASTDAAPAPLPTVFASRHGDLHKTLQLLQQLAAAEELSPSQFALSVHNAISGQFSIYSQNQADSNAIAAGADSLHYALLDAAARLQQDASVEQILVVYADEPVPAAYQSFCQDPSVPVALALLLHRSDGQRVQFNSHSDSSSVAESDQAIKLLPFLHGEQAELTLAGKQRRWCWSRAN